MINLAQKAVEQAFRLFVAKRVGDLLVHQMKYGD